jgi:hypothetical protein
MLKSNTPLTLSRLKKVILDTCQHLPSTPDIYIKRKKRRNAPIISRNLDHNTQGHKKQTKSFDFADFRVQRIAQYLTPIFHAVFTDTKSFPQPKNQLIGPGSFP